MKSNEKLNDQKWQMRWLGMYLEYWNTDLCTKYWWQFQREDAQWAAPDKLGKSSSRGFVWGGWIYIERRE